MWRPAPRLDLAQLQTTVTLRVSDGFVESFGPKLLEHIARTAPNVRLHVEPKLERLDAIP